MVGDHVGIPNIVLLLPFATLSRPSHERLNERFLCCTFSKRHRGKYPFSWSIVDYSNNGR
jgi:hypothetical protein